MDCPSELSTLSGCESVTRTSACWPSPLIPAPTLLGSHAPHPHSALKSLLLDCIREHISTLVQPPGSDSDAAAAPLVASLLPVSVSLSGLPPPATSSSASLAAASATAAASAVPPRKGSAASVPPTSTRGGGGGGSTPSAPLPGASAYQTDWDALQGAAFRVVDAALATDAPLLYTPAQIGAAALWLAASLPGDAVTGQGGGGKGAALSSSGVGGRGGDDDGDDLMMGGEGVGRSADTLRQRPPPPHIAAFVSGWMQRHIEGLGEAVAALAASSAAATASATAAGKSVGGKKLAAAAAAAALAPLPVTAAAAAPVAAPLDGDDEGGGNGAATAVAACAAMLRFAATSSPATAEVIDALEARLFATLNSAFVEGTPAQDARRRRLAEQRAAALSAAAGGRM